MFYDTGATCQVWCMLKLISYYNTLRANMHMLPCLDSLMKCVTFSNMNTIYEEVGSDVTLVVLS